MTPEPFADHLLLLLEYDRDTLLQRFELLHKRCSCIVLVDLRIVTNALVLGDHSLPLGGGGKGLQTERLVLEVLTDLEELEE